MCTKTWVNELCIYIIHISMHIYIIHVSMHIYIYVYIYISIYTYIASLAGFMHCPHQTRELKSLLPTPTTIPGKVFLFFTIYNLIIFYCLYYLFILLKTAIYIYLFIVNFIYLFIYYIGTGGLNLD